MDIGGGEASIKGRHPRRILCNNPPFVSRSRCVVLLSSLLLPSSVPPTKLGWMVQTRLPASHRRPASPPSPHRVIVITIIKGEREGEKAASQET